MQRAFSTSLLLCGLAGAVHAQTDPGLAKDPVFPPKNTGSTLPVASTTVAGGSFLGGGDDCSVAAVIAGTQVFPFDTTSATTSGFNGGGSCGSTAINQDVFWQWTATAAGTYVITTCGLATWDTKLSAHAGSGCAATCVAYNDDACGLQSKITLINVMAGDTFLIQAGGFGSASGTGMISIDFDPCSIGGGDIFEDNDDCPFAASLGDGSYPGLSVSKTDWDYYEVTVDNGGTLSIDLTFTHALGDVDIFLYAPGACVPFASGNVGTTGSLTSGFSASDNESITWTNSTGSAQTYSVKINIYPPTTTGDCNDYDMDVTGTTGSGGIGTNYCIASANSVSAAGSHLTAAGSTSLAAANLTLSSDNAPSQPSIFYFGPNQLQLAFGNGFRCVGGTVVRMPIVVGAGGAFTYAIDFGAFGGALGTLGTVNFQNWYRDPAGGGAFFNLSDGLEITFTP